MQQNGFLFSYFFRVAWYKGHELYFRHSCLDKTFHLNSPSSYGRLKARSNCYTKEQSAGPGVTCRGDLKRTYGVHILPDMRGSASVTRKPHSAWEVSLS